jgi:hypothetical protein
MLLQVVNKKMGENLWLHVFDTKMEKNLRAMAVTKAKNQVAEEVTRYILPLLLCYF